jgi:hypothetical protein
MSKQSFIQRLDAAIPKDGIFLALLRRTVRMIEPWTPNALLKASVRRRVRLHIPGEKEPKTPRWVSEAWVLLCLVLAAIALSIAAPIAQISSNSARVAVILLSVLWPAIRLFELTMFVVGWIFVHDAPLHSIQRSLLSFLLNLFEVALLLAALGISVAHLSSAAPWTLAYGNMVSLLSLAPPSDAVSGLGYRLEVFRFWFGLVVVLCIVSSLAGGIVRRTVPESGN